MWEWKWKIKIWCDRVIEKLFGYLSNPGLEFFPFPGFSIQPIFFEINHVTEKKKENFSSVEYFTYDEGTCVQCMHIGPYDSEPETVTKMHEYMIFEGYELDINETRYHHEIYISDVRKTAQEKLKTVIRHPIKKKS